MVDSSGIAHRRRSDVITAAELAPAVGVTSLLSNARVSGIQNRHVGSSASGGGVTIEKNNAYDRIPETVAGTRDC